MGRVVNIQSDLSRCWKELVLTDLAYKAFAFVLLSPLLGLLYRGMLAASGEVVLADLDILHFLIGPFGWACAILGGAVSLAVIALEQAALLGVLAASRGPRSFGASQAVLFAGRRAKRVFTVAVRVVAYSLLVSAPFVLLIGLIYSLLVNEHDINFYLKERPPEFLVAVALATVTAAIFTWILLRLISRWFLALPVVLFEAAPTANALRASAAWTEGLRRLIILEIIVWLVFSSLLSAVASGAVIVAGRALAPLFQGNLSLLVLVLGALVLAWVVLGLIANLISTVLFALVLFETYAHAGGAPCVETIRDGSDDVTIGRFRLSGGRLVALGLMGAMCSAIVGAWLVRTVEVNDEVAVIAHRGASARAPENTLAAIRLAIEEGADFVEIDVQETVDGQVAVFHDSDFMKLAGEPLRIWEATAADLESIDIGSSYSPEFDDERTPLLVDVLEVCKGRVDVLIELKYYGHDKQLEQRVLEVVAASEMESQVKFMSLKLPAVRKLKELNPDADAGILFSVAAGELRDFPADFWAMNASFADRKTVKKAHASGRPIYVWTVNDAVAMSRLIGRGVDGLITDDPKLARSVILHRSGLSPAERLLLELADLFGLDYEIDAQ